MKEQVRNILSKITKEIDLWQGKIIAQMKVQQIKSWNYTYRSQGGIYQRKRKRKYGHKEIKESIYEFSSYKLNIHLEQLCFQTKIVECW